MENLKATQSTIDKLFEREIPIVSNSRDFHFRFVRGNFNQQAIVATADSLQLPMLNAYSQSMLANDSYSTINFDDATLEFSKHILRKYIPLFKFDTSTFTSALSENFSNRMRWPKAL